MQRVARSLPLLIAIALCFLSGKRAEAQVTSADIVGTIVDASGAAVSSAKVTIVNLATNETRTAQPNSSGDYVFTLLRPGQYTVTAEANGFRLSKIPALTLAAGDRARADMTMQIGEARQVIEVTAQPPALQTDSSTLTGVVTDRAVQDLPLNGRNFITLVQNSPGITIGNPNAIGGGNRPDDRRQSNSVSANGQPEAYNNSLIDGMDNNEREQGLIMLRPSIDSIQEVKIDTNMYTAEVGRSAGAVVNVLTKSGANAFHGSAFEFLRNDKLDANNFFNNKAGSAKPEYRQNQFGGSLSGPIRRDRTFFFGDIEALRIVQGTPTGLLTVPTLYQKAHPGDFSDINGPVIAASKLDPVALKYFALYPNPNVPGAGSTNNFTNNPKRTQFSKTIDARVDHHFSDNDSFFARYSWNPTDTYTPGQLPAVGGIQAGGGSFPGPSQILAQGVQLNYVHIFSPTLIMELKAGFTRLNLQSLTLNYGTNAGQQFGMPNVSFDKFNSGLPLVNIAGYVSLGDSDSIPIVDINNVFQYNGSVTYTRGAHNIKAGGGLIRRQINYYQAISGQGGFTFSGTPPQTMANFLQGTATTITRTNQLYTNYLRGWEPHVYVQDDWHAARWLTLNLGLRWDYFSPITNSRNQRSNFDLSTLTMRVATPDDPSAGVRSDYKNFAPRFGFAANLGRGTVLRGGFGMSFYPGDNAAGTINSVNPPFTFGTFTCQPASTNSALKCPAGIGTLSQGPPLPVMSSITNLSGGLRAIPFDARSSYVEQFNLTLEKQFGQNVVTASYIGELGRRQSLIVQANLPAPSANTPTYVYQTQLPNVNTIQLRNPTAESAYHAAQLSFKRRLSQGLVVNGGYTFASNLNDFSQPNGALSTVQLVVNNRKYDWGNSDIAVRQRFTLTANYELPFGKSANGLKRTLIEGWQVNTVAYWQTGLPFTVMDSAFASAPINLPGVTSDRPSVVSGQSLTVANPGISQWFNINAFTPQTRGTAGTEGRNQLWGPHSRQVDFSFFKNFTLREALRLQFRAEAYNISNTVNFAQPVSTITGFSAATNTPTQAGSFGQITSTRLGSFPRQIQFALKLTF